MYGCTALAALRPFGKIIVPRPSSVHSLPTPRRRPSAAPSLQHPLLWPLGTRYAARCLAARRACSALSAGPKARASRAHGNPSRVTCAPRAAAQRASRARNGPSHAQCTQRLSVRHVRATARHASRARTSGGGSVRVARQLVLALELALVGQRLGQLGEAARRVRREGGAAPRDDRGGGDEGGDEQERRGEGGASIRRLLWRDGGEDLREVAGGCAAGEDGGGLRLAGGAVEGGRGERRLLDHGGARLDRLGVGVGRVWVDLGARVVAGRRDPLAEVLLVLLDVGLGREVGRVAANRRLILALPDAHVINVEGGGPVLAVNRRLAAVPRADRSVHHERHRLLRDHARGRAVAVGTLGGRRTDLVRAKRPGRHAPDELAVIVPRDVAVGTGGPLHAVRPVARVQRVLLRDAARQRVGAARRAARTPRRAVPAVVRLAHVSKRQVGVPRAGARLRREAEERRAEEGGHAGGELQRADHVRRLARVGDGTLQHIQLRRAAPLVRVQPRVRRLVDARRNLLRRVGRRQLQIRVALIVRPRPQPCVGRLVDGATQVAKSPERRPVAAATGLPRAELQDAAREAKLVPRL
mmetsp:Transcript_1957/g.5092  ORF Transcript_1957/g.5092 Transcript_1957/m.5092 type:complete len:584 (+) Transcript_1957:415-2166(+)